MKNILVVFVALFLSSSTSAHDVRSNPCGSDVTYKIKIEASPLVRTLAGEELPGEAQIRLTIFGDNGSVLGGKLCKSIIPNITLVREDVGRISGIEISLNGSRWTLPVRIDRVTIRVSGEQIESHTFRADVGYSLTPGNKTIYIDEGGADPDFVEDSDAVMKAELAGLAKTMGNFKDGDVQYGEFTISKRSQPNSEKPAPHSRNPKQDPDSPEGWECTTQQVSATASFDENFISRPNDEAYFPGAILYAEDIASGSYIANTKKRKPITISTDLAITNGDPKMVVDNPDLANIRTALNRMLVHQDKGAFQMSAQFEVIEVFSKDQLSIALGGHFAYGPGSLDFDFNYNKESEKHTIVAKFSQEYYQVNVNQFDNPYADVFVNRPDAEEVLNSGKTPLYVGSVTYGRVAYFTMTTSKTLQDVSATLTAAYNSKVVEVESSVAADFLSLRQESNMHALVIGGDASQGFGAVDGYIGFKEMVRKGGELDQTSLGKPIAYTLRFLSDNSIARTNLATDYTKRTCKKKAKEINTVVDYLFKFDGIKCEVEEDQGGTSEIYYTIYAQLVNEKGLAVNKNGLPLSPTAATTETLYPNKTAIARSSVGRTSYISYVDDGDELDLNKTEKFSIDGKNVDLSKLRIKVTANIYDEDDGDDEHIYGSQEFYLSQDLSQPKMNYINARHTDGDHFKVYFNLTKEDNLLSEAKNQ